MHSVCRTQLKRNLLLGAAVVLVVALFVAVLLLLPEPASTLIDPGELPGEPLALPSQYGYTQVAPPTGGCTIRFCGAPEVDGKDVYLYLTNLPVNAHLVRAEVYTAVAVVDKSTGQTKFEPGKLLGSTGFIHPGTYVEKVTLDHRLTASETRVYIKIATRNEETGQSEGYFYVGTTLSK